MAQIDSRLGDMIRSYREKLGLTQEEMAERLQVTLVYNLVPVYPKIHRQ